MYMFFSSFINHNDFYKRILLIALFGCVFFFVYQSLGDILTPFFISFIGAYLLNKIACYFDHILPRPLIAALLILVLITCVVVLSSIVLPFIKAEILELSAELPMLTDRLIKRTHSLFSIQQNVSESARLFNNSVQTEISKHYGDIVDWLLKISGNLLSGGMVLANTLSIVILTPIIMFYFLKDWKKITLSFLNIMPDNHIHFIKHLIKKIDHTLTSYLVGQSIVCFILSCMYVIALSFTGIEKAWLIGLISGILSFIPYLGHITGLIISLSISFANFTNWSPIISVLAVFFCISLLEGNVISPKIVGSRIGLHPLWMLFSILVGGTWFGFPGVLIAIPTASVLLVFAKELREYLNNGLKY